jgi:hypothetical protein
MNSFVELRCRQTWTHVDGFVLQKWLQELGDDELGGDGFSAQMV